MLIPRYWATHTAKYRQYRTRFAMQRFGWSLTSQQEAEEMARARADQAVQHRLAGGRPVAREPKVPYNGAEGVPIREEIVDTHGGIVITRNPYGARCMNVADVCFVDVDNELEPVTTRGRGFSRRLMDFYSRDHGSRNEEKKKKKNGPRAVVLYFLFLMAANVLLVFGWKWSGWLFLVSMLVAYILVRIVSPLLDKSDPEHAAELEKEMKNEAEKLEKEIKNEMEKLADEEEGAGFRLYKTPAGFRVIATHKTFDPASEEVVRLFQRLHADPVYVRMCLRQKCFRARISAKPWRIGITHRISSAAWPVSEEIMPRRKSWIKAYEEKAAQYAACRFIGAIGSTTMSFEVSAAVQLHDQLCAALSDKPCA